MRGDGSGAAGACATAVDIIRDHNTNGQVGKRQWSLDKSYQQNDSGIRSTMAAMIPLVS